MSKQEMVPVSDLIRQGLLRIEDGNHGEYRPRRSEFSDNGVSFIRAADMTPSGIRFEVAEKINDVAYSRIRKGIGAPLDVILSHKGTVGKVALAPVDSPSYVCSPQTTFWRSSDHARIDPRFLYFALLSRDFQDQLHALQGESDMAPYVSLTEQRKLRLPLPDPTRQRNITERLGALDDKIALNERIAVTAYKLIRAKYEDALCAGAITMSISEIADVYDGPHATPKKTRTGPWFLSISSLSQGRLKLEESAHLDEVDFERWTRRVTPTAGDLLFSYETRLGEAALMPSGIRACLGRRMALLRPRSVGSGTLLQAFLSQSFQETIRRYSVHGATVDRIPLTEFPSWKIALPAEGTQLLEETLSELGELAERRERENATLGELRDALLPKLMTGEIRVREAEKVVEDVV